MNKSAIKTFAIWARNKLIADISYKAGLLGITDKEIKQPTNASTEKIQFFDIGAYEPYQITGSAIAQRRTLVDKIREKEKQTDYATAYKTVIEEVAYTWFNRLIAVRFLEVNDYIPSRVRVLSSISGKAEPDIVTTPFDAELDFSQSEREYVIACKNDNKLDELFCMLFIKQCNALNDILPQLFERIDNYMELLLNISFTDKDCVVWHLVNDISDDDFKEAVEIIGWMYQYYNTEPKDETFALLKKNVKITKERIPAATQLFTPHWIVRYMVENSLGRLWLERHPNDDLKANWKYYLDEAEQTPEVQAKLDELRLERRGMSPEDITFLDPCMGSGHILVYAFDVFMQIYESAGYSQRDAAKLILEKNIHGLDIDKRAYQLAYFALMMKARQYNRRIFEQNTEPQVFHPIGWQEGEQFGSLIEIAHLESKPEIAEGQLEISDLDDEAKLRIWNFKRLLSQKYDVVVTNPPYMGGKGQSGILTDFLKKNFPDTKSDTFSAFIECCGQLCNRNGYIGMFTPYVWMFIQSYEKLRKMICAGSDIATLIQFEYSAFEEATVPVCTFVLRRGKIGSTGEYFRLVDFRGGMEVQRQKTLEAIANPSCGYRYTTTTDNFAKIPGMPISYWASENMLRAFEVGKRMDEIVEPKVGLQTGDNDSFIRYWWEVEFDKVSLNSTSREDALKSTKKWFPYNKGGLYRRWFGNYDYVVNWENDGEKIRSFVDDKGKQRSVIRNPKYYFREAITWSDVTSGSFSLRFRAAGSIHDVSGMSAFSTSKDVIYYLLGLLNTKVGDYVFRLVNPTMHLQIGNFQSFPVFYMKNENIHPTDVVLNNIEQAVFDWNMFETSWDFRRHPLV